MARQLLIAGNWKMNKCATECVQLIGEIKTLIGDSCCSCAQQPEVLICPPFTTLATAVAEAKGSCLQVGAQNVHWAEQGAFTGEISGGMLNECGVSHVIIGHSERRQYFGETDETVNQRLKAALKHGLTAVVCVGETLAEREAGSTNTVVEQQLRGALADICADGMKKVVIAYEPVWAIGTGKVASDEQAQEAHASIRALLKTMFCCSDVAENTRILYGGSMNAANAAGLLAQPDIDGGLIGGASLKPADFVSIIKTATQA
jgi:triosephosphate isomerase